MLIGFIGLKGGAGKTSLALTLAACAQDDGQRAMLVDVDPAGLAHCWRPEGFFGCVQWPSSELAGLTEAAMGVDVATIDVATGDLDAMLALSTVVDALAIPCLPSPLDVQMCAALLEQLERHGVMDRVPVRVVLNRVDLRTSLGRRARQDLEAAGFPMADTVIGERVAMSDALARGEIATRVDPRLREEIRRLTHELSRAPRRGELPEFTAH